MGETLGIAHNVFEEMERKKDRKERLKKYEEWTKDQEKRKNRLKDMQARIKEVERTGVYSPDHFRSPALSKRGISTSSLLSVENDLENEVKRDQLKKYEAWRKLKKQSLCNMGSQEREGEFSSPIKKQMGNRSSSASGLPSKDDEERRQEFGEFDLWKQDQDVLLKELKSGDKEESGIFINHLSTPTMAKRCYSTSGIPSEDSDVQLSKKSEKKLESHKSAEWFKSKSVSRTDSNVILDQPANMIPPDLKGSKSFIGSSTKTISIPKDLEDITLDEKQDQSLLVCGNCLIL